jgi:thioester reductase-like protein
MGDGAFTIAPESKRTHPCHRRDRLSGRARLVRELLERQPQATGFLGAADPRQARPIGPAARRLDRSSEAERARVQVYSGDVSLPNCGLDAATWQRLSAETTRVIHSAATVRFDHSLDEARRINVEGTRRMLDFAAGARQLRSLAYVGTAYVAGERTGLVRESELAVGPELPQHLRADQGRGRGAGASRLGSLPGVILRPSIIVGDSRTGAPQASR